MNVKVQDGFKMKKIILNRYKCSSSKGLRGAVQEVQDEFKVLNKLTKILYKNLFNEKYLKY